MINVDELMESIKKTAIAVEFDLACIRMDLDRLRDSITAESQPQPAKLPESPETTGRCINCGLPLTKNTHPEAGTLKMLNTVGAVYGCLPCAERRANGRREVIAALARWLQKAEDQGTLEVSANDVLQKLAELENARRRAYHAAFAEAQQNV